MNKINRKDNCRYGFTAYHNVNYSYTVKVLPGIQNLDVMTTPYTKLIAYLKDETLAEPGREQQFANLLTTIHSYLAFAGKSEDSAVGPELGSGFDDCCRRYCSSLGLSERTVRDRRSLLNKWRAAADHLRGAVRGQRSEASTELKKSADFCEQLRSAVARAGVSAKALAKSVHMSPATLTRWLRGAYPNVRARPALARIESFCGLPRGQLSGLLNAADRIKSKASVHVEPVEFRERLSKRIKSRYRLNPREFSDPFLDELKAFYVYKTTRRPAFLRSRKGVWAVSPRDQRPDQPPVLIATDSVCVAIPKGGFKNSKSKGVSDYDVGISASLTARIDDYLENYRPLLLEGEEDNGILFPNKDTGGVHAGLGRHVFKLTARLIPGCPGIAPHAIRHLSATSWLKNHPDDLITVAEMLNDRLETVLRNYAHLRKDDSLARYATHVEALFNAE